MPQYTGKITRTRTTTEFAEFEFTAANEDKAQEKAEAKADKAQTDGWENATANALDWTIEDEEIELVETTVEEC
jgi:hypothetical protein